MGNHRFRLSDMMPNAWFYKLRDMNSSSSSSKAKNQHPSSHHPIHKKLPPSSQTRYPTRKSFIPPSAEEYRAQKPEFVRVDDKLLYSSPTNSKTLDTRFPVLNLQRKSSSRKQRRTNRKTIYMPSPRQVTPSPSVDHGFQDPENSVWLNNHETAVHFQGGYFSSSDDQDFLGSPSSEFECRDSSDAPPRQKNSSLRGCKLNSSATDIIIDMEKVSYETISIHNRVSDQFDMISEPELDPIVTKPTTKCSFPEKSLTKSRISSETGIQQKKTTSTARKSVSRSSGGVRIRRPKLAASKKATETTLGGRKSVKGGEKKGGSLFYADSFALVKSSFDPERDFRESMMEMIVENNIKASKDLEELLACYLSLNSNKYHDLIIKAFERIWFSMPPQRASSLPTTHHI